LELPFGKVGLEEAVGGGFEVGGLPSGGEGALAEPALQAFTSIFQESNH